jgi:hypothetical protein
VTGRPEQTPSPFIYLIINGINQKTIFAWFWRQALQFPASISSMAQDIVGAVHEPPLQKIPWGIFLSDMPET